MFPNQRYLRLLPEALIWVGKTLFANNVDIFVVFFFLHKTVVLMKNFKPVTDVLQSPAISLVNVTVVFE